MGKWRRLREAAWTNQSAALADGAAGAAGGGAVIVTLMKKGM